MLSIWKQMAVKYAITAYSPQIEVIYVFLNNFLFKTSLNHQPNMHIMRRNFPTVIN